jgi:hypothetical protein
VRLGIARPPVVAGRRLWGASDVLAVARHLGLDSLPVREACQAELARRAAEPVATHAELAAKVLRLSAEAGRDLLGGRDSRAVPLAELRRIISEAAARCGSGPGPTRPPLAPEAGKP